MHRSQNRNNFILESAEGEQFLEVLQIVHAQEQVAVQLRLSKGLVRGT